MLNEKKKGELAELKIVGEALKRNLMVSRPWGDSYLFDLIITNYDYKSFLIQVKSRTGLEKGRQSTRFTLTTGQHKEIFYTGIDAFALVTGDDFWMIPFEVVKGKRQIRTSSIWDDYKNNFDCLG